MKEQKGLVVAGAVPETTPCPVCMALAAAKEIGEQLIDEIKRNGDHEDRSAEHAHGTLV